MARKPTIKPDVLYRVTMARPVLVGREPIVTGSKVRGDLLNDINTDHKGAVETYEEA